MPQLDFSKFQPYALEPKPPGDGTPAAILLDRLRRFGKGSADRIGSCEDPVIAAPLAAKFLDQCVSQGLAVRDGEVYRPAQEHPAAPAAPVKPASPPVAVALPAEPAPAPAPAPAATDPAVAAVLAQAMAAMQQMQQMQQAMAAMQERHEAERAELLGTVRRLQGQTVALEAQKDPEPEEPPAGAFDVGEARELARWIDEAPGCERRWCVAVLDYMPVAKRKKPLPMIRICHPCRNGDGNWIAPYGTSGKGFAAVLNKPLEQAASPDWIEHQKGYLDALHRYAVQVAVE